MSDFVVTDDCSISQDDIRLSLNLVSGKIKQVMCQLTETKDTKKRLVDLLSQTVGVEDILKQQLRVEIEKGTKLKKQLNSMNIEQCERDFNAIEANNFLAQLEDDGEKEKYVVIELSSAPEATEQSGSQFLLNGASEETNEPCLDDGRGLVLCSEKSFNKMNSIAKSADVNSDLLSEPPINRGKQFKKQRSVLYSGYVKADKYSGSRKKHCMKYRSKMSGVSVSFRHKENNSLTGIGMRNL